MLACALLATAVLTAGVVTPRANATTLAGDCSPAADWGTVRSDLASQTLTLVNNHRASLGLRTLVASPALTASAVWKARHMAKYGYMGHSDPAPPVARTTAERMQACGVTGSWGENIAAGYTTAQSVFNGWLGSSGHRANIENPNFVGIGSGAAANSSGQVYWAQAFSTSSGGATPAPPPPSPPPVPAPPPPSPPPAPAPPAPAPPPSPKPPAPKPPAPGQPAPAPPATPAIPGTPGTPGGAPGAASAAGVVLQGLKIAPRKPQAGRKMKSSVAAFRRGVRIKNAAVFCSGRLEGRVLKVLSRRFRKGTATCVWRIPNRARHKLISAVIIVQQGRLEAAAPFRARVGG